MRIFAPLLILMGLSPSVQANECLEIFRYLNVENATQNAVTLFKEAVIYDSQKTKPPEFKVEVVNKYEAALVYIEQVLAARPQDQKFLLMKTKALTQSGRLEEALETVNQLLAIDSHLRPALIEKEDIFFRMRKFEEQKLVRLLINFIEKLGEDFNPYARL